jgi:hypothetical protein
MKPFEHFSGNQVVGYQTYISRFMPDLLNCQSSFGVIISLFAHLLQIRALTISILI